MNKLREILLVAAGCAALITGCGPSKPVGEKLEGMTVDPCSLNAPVCGDNGHTYNNTCAAELSDVTIDYLAPCGCDATLSEEAHPLNVQGHWGSSSPWPIQLVLKDGSITRYDYVTDCASGLGCPNGAAAVSVGTYMLSGPLIHLVWDDPTNHPAVELPELYLYEGTCKDGDPYLIELVPESRFYGKQ